MTAFLFIGGTLFLVRYEASSSDEGDTSVEHIRRWGVTAWYWFLRAVTARLEQRYGPLYLQAFSQADDEKKELPK